MKKTLIGLTALLLGAVSCSDNAQNVAEGMCDCYEKSDVSFSKSTQKLLADVSESKDPLKTYTKAIEKMDEEEQIQVGEEIQQAAALSSNEKVKECVEKVDAKYKVAGSNEKNMLKEVMEHMKSKGGQCAAFAGLMNLGMEAGGTEDTEDAPAEEN